MNALIALKAAGRLPGGKNIGVITISGGGGVVVADKCPQFGLEVVRLTEKTQRSLREFFPSYGAVANPVDLTSAIFVDESLFQKAIQTVMATRWSMWGFIISRCPTPKRAEDHFDVYYPSTPLVIFTWPTGQTLPSKPEKMIRPKA